ncbi:phosphotransferase [Natronosalvus amylolyticus]|uniref:phosphotransferase n=1 Tax=Natronosalvus amylolyticus TaxID=2961994 RepID=UPI0020CA19A0|nr:phosphotransferase [Natronosalvus amylolyticus]
MTRNTIDPARSSPPKPPGVSVPSGQCRSRSSSPSSPHPGTKRNGWLALFGHELEGPYLTLGPDALRCARALEVYTTASGEPIFVQVSNQDALETLHATRISPLLGIDRRPPLETDAVGTVVADWSERTPSTISDSLESIRDTLRTDGTLVFTADGPTGPLLRTLRESQQENCARSRSIAAAVGSTVGRYRTLAERAGFETVDIYAFVPDAATPSYLFPVGDEGTIVRLLEFIFAELEYGRTLGETSLSIVSRAGPTRALLAALCERLVPSLLVVCSNTPRAERICGQPVLEDCRPLVLPGRSRSVVLEIASDDRVIERVWKVPNCPQNAPLTAREHALLSWLRAPEHGFSRRETLPAGRAVETAVGTARMEVPTQGTALSERLEGDPDSFEAVLETGLEWLLAFQQTFRSERFEPSPQMVRDELTFEPTGLEPPPLSASVPTFTTPVHGDFMPSNVHVDDEGTVTGVIDWEYGAADGCPIVDAGLFLLDTAKRVFGGYPAALEALSPSLERDALSTPESELEPYRDAAQRYLAAYCRTLEIPPRTISVYLPAIYLHRLRIDWHYQTTIVHDETLAARSRFVERLYEARLGLE